MKVLLLSNKAPYPPNDGSSIAIYNMAKGLAEAGAEVYLLTINTLKHYKPDEDVPKEFKQQTHYKSVKIDTNITPSGLVKNLFSNQSYFVSRFYNAAFNELLEKLLKQTSFDVVQLEGLFMGNYLGTIRRYSKAKVVVRTHNVEHHIWEKHIAHEKNPIKKQYLKLQNARLKKFELDTLIKADAIASISESDTTYFKKLFPQKLITTSITGLDIHAIPSPQKFLDENTLFIFSSMDWLPNQEAVDWFLNTCWEKLKQKNKALKLIIAGRNMPQKYTQLHDERVTVFNNVPRAEDIYTNYNIMLVPLLSGSGLRIKLIEGLSYGKAIVSTYTGAEGIPLTNGKECLLASDADSFVDAILRVTTDKVLQRGLQAQAKAYAHEHFDNLKISERLLVTYKTWFTC